MGRFLDKIRDSAPFNAESSELHAIAKEAKNAKEAPFNSLNSHISKPDELYCRLDAAHISIAIDRETQRPLLLFKPSDAEIVMHCADVYQPFEVVLTPAQRLELEADLNYYDQVMQRNGGRAV